jgi:hypothetical protein
MSRYQSFAGWPAIRGAKGNWDAGILPLTAHSPTRRRSVGSYNPFLHPVTAEHINQRGNSLTRSVSRQSPAVYREELKIRRLQLPTGDVNFAIYRKDLSIGLIGFCSRRVQQRIAPWLSSLWPSLTSLAVFREQFHATRFLSADLQ